MSVDVQWHGLEEFRAALRALPEDLAEEAGAIVLAHAADADRQVEAAYPMGPTGNLKRGVRTLVTASSRFGTSATVKSTAYHAWLFEHGCRGRATRAPQQGKQMIPIVIRVRRRMVEALIHMVQRAGLVVTQS